MQVWTYPIHIWISCIFKSLHLIWISKFTWPVGNSDLLFAYDSVQHLGYFALENSSDDFLFLIEIINQIWTAQMLHSCYLLSRSEAKDSQGMIFRDSLRFWSLHRQKIGVLMLWIFLTGPWGANHVYYKAQILSWKIAGATIGGGMCSVNPWLDFVYSIRNLLGHCKRKKEMRKWIIFEADDNRTDLQEHNELQRISKSS